jgi:hypothetical protein
MALHAGIPGVDVRVYKRIGISLVNVAGSAQKTPFLLVSRHSRPRLFAKKNYRAGLPYDLNTCKYDD